MLGAFGIAKAKTRANPATHEHRHQHTKTTLEGCLTCWLFVAVTLSAALSQDAEKLAIDAGYTDLKRAHSERSIVVLGEKVRFKNYYIVKMLDQYFTLVQDAPQEGEYELKEDGKSKTIVIH
jgi:hypothetical protein